MTTYDWRDLLTRWSQKVLASPELRAGLPAEVIASGWLGYPGATEAELAQAEARLGRVLPPSYRQFLQTSNGWRKATVFIDQLWSSAAIDWFRVRHQDWIDAWTAGANVYGGPRLPDHKYLTYGPQQDPSWIREEYLPTALDISAVGDFGSTIYLLNPQIVTPEGEWEAWFFATWLPGARRYRSFWELMQAEFQTLDEV